jgi:glycosyltransferase involved in cell wall biosynthesis
MKILKTISNSINYRKGIYYTNVLNVFRENIFWYRLSYLFNSAYYSFTSGKYKFSKKIIDLDNINSVALIFSKNHFNPENDEKFKIKPQHSVSNMSRQIYKIFEGKKIYYFDHYQIIGDMPKVDLVVGLVSSNYTKVAMANPQAKRIVFLVNCHPLFRLNRLIKESIVLKKLFPYSEYLPPMVFLKLVKFTDKFIAVGNGTVAKTFLDYKIPHENLSIINTGVNRVVGPDNTKRPKDKIRILYNASDLGIRKGLFRIMQVWDLLQKDNFGIYELIIIGGVNKFSGDLNNFITRHNNVTYLGWIDSNKEDYRNWLQSCSIQINLSLEEGQVGCVLDGMTCGVIPIITIESGIDLIHGEQGFIVKHDDIQGIVEIINLLKDSNKREYIEKNTLKSVKETYTWENFEINFRNALIN